MGDLQIKTENGEMSTGLGNLGSFFYISLREYTKCFYSTAQSIKY